MTKGINHNHLETIHFLCENQKKHKNQDSALSLKLEVSILYNVENKKASKPIQYYRQFNSSMFQLILNGL